MKGTSSLVVAERELLRTGRRWQTMGARCAFAVVLFVVVGGVYGVQSAMQDSFSVTSLHEIGRSLFMTWAWVQFVAVLAITPLIVGQAIIDEKDEQTLELLAITRLSPNQILWGKLLSRLVGVEGIMLAGLPVLALVLGFGGVGPLEMFGAFAMANVTMLVCGAVATFSALYARSPVIVALQTWGWLFVGWAVVGLPLGAVVSWGAGGAFLGSNPASALGAVLAGRSVGLWSTLLVPAIVWSIVAAAVMKVAAVCFSTLALGTPDADSADADLSAGFWKLDKLVRVLWPVGILCFLLTPVMLFTSPASKFVPVLPTLLGYAWLTVTYSVGGVAYLLLIRKRTLRNNLKKKKNGGRKVGWERLARHYDEVPASESGAWQAVVGAGEDREHHVAEALAGKRKRRRRLSPFNRKVWDDPVAWRESVTSAHGQLRGGLAGFYVTTGILFGLVLLAGGFSDDEATLLFGVMVLMVLPPLVLLLATSSIVGERRAGSLELLCATRLTAAKILRGKLYAVAFYIGPALALGTLLVMAGSTDIIRRQGPGIIFGGLAWYYALILTLPIFGMWRALAVKAPAQAWVVNILTPLLLSWLLSAFSILVAEEMELFAWVWGLVVPFAMVEANEDLIVLYLFLSAGFWGLMAGAMFLRAAHLLKRRAAAM